MCILLSLVFLGTYRRGWKVGNKWKNKPYETILCSLPHPVPLVLMVVDSNHFCYVSLGNYTISAQFILHMWGQSEYFSTSTISSWVFTISCSLVPFLFVGFYFTLFFFWPFIILAGWLVHVYYIKFPLRIVLGAPIPILKISSNIIPWFIDSPGLNIVKYLNITIIDVPYFIFGTCLGYVTSPFLNCCKERSFFL